MARYEIHHSCGHKVTHRLAGPQREQDSRAEWLAGTLCDECWKKQQQEEKDRENALAAAANREQNLPSLLGSEKQVGWAETIRARLLEGLDKFMAANQEKGSDLVAQGKMAQEQMEIDLYKLQGYMDILRVKEHASWWIDHRESTIPELLQEAFQEARETPAPPSPQEKELARDAQAEATIRPSGTPKTETVVEITVISDTLFVSPPEMRKDFHVVMGACRMIWDPERYRWARKIDARSGPIADRAVEIGVRLLAKGFVIRIHDEVLRGRILAGEYEPERTRWVTVCSAKGKDCFALSWHRESNLYALAKRIPGTYWSRTLGSVVAPAEQYEQVMDFAGTHGFAVSQNARALVQTAEASARAALVAPDTLAPIPPEAVQAADTMPPKLEIPGDVQVDPDLRDDE